MPLATHHTLCHNHRRNNCLLFSPSAPLAGENVHPRLLEMSRRPRHHIHHIALIAQFHSTRFHRFLRQAVYASNVNRTHIHSSNITYCSGQENFACSPRPIHTHPRYDRRTRFNTYLSKMQKDIFYRDSFAEFYAERFKHHYSQFSALINPAQPAFAASVYLFRYDPRLSSEFVQSTVDAFARSFADLSGKSVLEARRVFTSHVKNTAREYFANDWHNIDRFIKTNAPILQTLQKQNTELSNITENVQGSDGTIEVDPVLLQALLEKNLPVLLLVYADYCSVCKAVRPIFDEAAKHMNNLAYCVRLNGPRAPEFKSMFGVHTYPSLLRFETGTKLRRFALSQGATIDKLVSFAQGTDLDGDSETKSDRETDTESESYKETETDDSSVVKTMLLRQGIDQLDDLAKEREKALRSELSYPIECDDNSCRPIPVRNDTSKGASAPLCVLLGGGMGAGKTTAINFVSQTPFWKKYGFGVVVVEADAFKLNDPLFVVLQSVTPLASRIVHQDSIRAAEDLFLQAVNNRRDVLLDGTLSWCEYAKQTINMLKDTEYYYERGPGYQESEDGNVVEKYWIRGKKRESSVPPYSVELVGVTAEAEISVMRGIVRKITTGRGVAVPDQLRSHALFSENFECYVDLVDSVYLFDTTVAKESSGGSNTPQANLIAIKEGMLFQTDEEEKINSIAENHFIVRHPPAYARFLRKKYLNTAAQGTEELYTHVEHSNVGM